ncbi:replication protein [Acinetobacter haemolyticus]|uniref:replication initiation factor domain-containing protein n=1 Tax=Acinetobacter haemolyticus TaxID=29430 RepID=UPI001373248D|nr:replication initiation factor domain-containing protein [Acinetobacter haemolyticus]NAR63974.1 replication protein [Acinetobacter haemolyticus]NAR63984.1 replication protein [Acinetobacter haemolyticus]
MKNLLSLIQDFDNSHLSVKDVFDRQKSIFDEIHASTAFGDVSLADGQTLKNMLNGIVANKLDSVEQLINSKSSKGSDSSIQEIFAQKVANTVLNTAESTPFYNIGVADTQTQSESWAFPRNLDNYHLISTPQGVVPVLRAVPIENSPCGLDWVTFSFCQTTFGHKCAGLNPEHVEDAVGESIELYLDQLLFEIFGFGIAQKREKGMHFNKYGYDLQDNLGLILYGHNNKRITVQINGTGCALARKGWNEQLYKFLKSQAISPKLNRVDIAFDDFESEWVSVDLADQWDSQDLFWCGGRNSEINKLGDWKRVNGKGRTLTIGNRSSSKFLRFYERGKKEGDSLSLWTRAELELKSTDRYLPLDILLSPSTYFKGAYPALEMLMNQLNDFVAPEKCQLIEKQANINVDKALDIVKVQFGKYIRQFRKFINDSDLLNIISSDKDVVPKRLNFSHAAVMQALRVGEPIKTKTITDTPLFEGVPFLTSNEIFYEGLTHAI